MKNLLIIVLINIVGMLIGQSSSATGSTSTYGQGNSGSAGGASQNAKPKFDMSLCNTESVSLIGKTSIFSSDDSTLAPDCRLKIWVNREAYRYVQENKDSVRLWMNGACMKSNAPLFISSDSSITFILKYDTLRSSVWADYYSYPNYFSISEKSIEINAGTSRLEFKKKVPKTSDVNTSIGWMIGLGCFIIVLAMLPILMRGRTLLVDYKWLIQEGISVSKSAPSNADEGVLNIKHAPYSLARLQFCLWLCIIFISIVYVWMFIDSLAIPTGTVLTLLGISGTTFFISGVIDGDPNVIKVVDVTKRKILIEKLIARGSIKFRIVNDILYDGDAISLHRLQLVLFTGFLAVYFIWQVIYSLKLPQFDGALLTLMGISSSTYAGIKTQEKQG